MLTDDLVSASLAPFGDSCNHCSILLVSLSVSVYVLCTQEQIVHEHEQLEENSLCNNFIGIICRVFKKPNMSLCV